jgi:hypothetical protein
LFQKKSLRTLSPLQFKQSNDANADLLPVLLCYTSKLQGKGSGVTGKKKVLAAQSIESACCEEITL